jgi:hypothetical protein
MERRLAQEGLQVLDVGHRNAPASIAQMPNAKRFVMPRLGLGIHEFAKPTQETRGSQGQALG